jgi:hypothetical protein
VKLVFVFLLALSLGSADSFAMQPAPRQLYGKTVHFSFTARYAFRDPGGKTTTPTVEFLNSIYVSNGGRLFYRLSTNFKTSGASGQSDVAPGSTANSEGEAVQFRFEGRRLIGIVAHERGATRATTTFDASFSSCASEFTFGRTDGESSRRKGLDGRTYEIVSREVIAKSCSIQEGNAFAAR